MAKAYDHLFKLLLIGDSGVGKTCVLLRFCDSAFSTTFISTIGIDFKIRTIELDGRKIKLQIWDTAGQERFKTITTAYYRGAMGIMLVYDITSEKSFDNIKNWIRNIEEHASAEVERMLIGNKCDMHDKRQVSREKGENLANDYGIKFMETSAKGNLNVDEAFFAIAKDIKAKIDKKAGTNPSAKFVEFGKAHTLTSAVINQINELRSEEEFSRLLGQITEFHVENNIDLSVKVKQRTISTRFLNCLVTKMNDRFSKSNMKILRGISSPSSDSSTFLKAEELTDKCIMLQCDIVSLSNEIQVLKPMLKQSKSKD
ncbi:unnamed protein product, partial [Rotaria magnacalcarata]